MTLLLLHVSQDPPPTTSQPGPSSRSTYANVATPDAGKLRKKNKGKGVAMTAQVATSSLAVAPEKGTALLPATNCRFFASH